MMPIMQIYFSADEQGAVDFEPLLKEASDFYCDTFYPEVKPRPIERIRVFVQEVSSQHWATAGRLVSQGGAVAPYFTVLALTGRPSRQLNRLMSGLTKIVSHHLNCEPGMVRGQICEIDSAHWFIGGISAAQARASETLARETGFATRD